MPAEKKGGGGTAAPAKGSDAAAALAKKGSGKAKDGVGTGKAKDGVGTGSKMCVDLPLRVLKIGDDPRKAGDGGGPFKDLKRSIKANGIVQRLIVSPDPEVEGKFLIREGRRRYRAARELKHEDVPCEIRPFKKTERHLDLMLNLQRADLSAMDEARAYKTLLDAKAYKSQRDLAGAVGYHESRISSKLDLLKLPADLQEAVDSGKLPATTAEKAAKSPEAIKKLRDDLKAGRRPTPPGPGKSRRVGVPKGDLAGVEGLSVGVYEDKAVLQFTVTGNPSGRSFDPAGDIRAALTKVGPDELRLACSRARRTLGEDS